MKIDDLLRLMVSNRASDLHLKADTRPLLRIDGELIPEDKLSEFSSEEIWGLVCQMIGEEQKEKFNQEKELDFAYDLSGLARFRVNTYLQRGQIGVSIRAIPWDIPTLDKLGFPPVIKELALKPRGLVLVTGPTGGGKSTTLAAIINYINVNRRCQVITIEDPIEFVHKNKLSNIDQRELGSDTLSFANALKHVLRQDPDVILVGEMRDLETIALAITAAETGHLVFSTLHTTGAAATIDRIIDVFPPNQQAQVRLQISTLLEGVVSQILLPCADSKGRVAALEVMISTPAIRNLIRENKVFQIPSVMQTGVSLGMQTLDHALRKLCEEKLITYEEALAKCNDPEQFQKMLPAGRLRETKMSSSPTISGTVVPV